MLNIWLLKLFLLLLLNIDPYLGAKLITTYKLACLAYENYNPTKIIISILTFIVNKHKLTREKPVTNNWTKIFFYLKLFYQLKVSSRHFYKRNKQKILFLKCWHRMLHKSNIIVISSYIKQPNNLYSDIFFMTIKMNNGPHNFVSHLHTLFFFCSPSSDWSRFLEVRCKSLGNL
uniref:Secreted protein n=1 Tax=Heterorhabditis bacteriophora TaxID=37862 RepID=A0A1I7WBD5_HETBA